MIGRIISYNSVLSIVLAKTNYKVRQSFSIQIVPSFICIRFPLFEYSLFEILCTIIAMFSADQVAKPISARVLHCPTPLHIFSNYDNFIYLLFIILLFPFIIIKFKFLVHWLQTGRYFTKYLFEFIHLRDLLGRHLIRYISLFLFHIYIASINEFAGTLHVPMLSIFSGSRDIPTFEIMYPRYFTLLVLKNDTL